MIRGIQIIGFFIALAVIVFIVFAKKKGRMNSRFFLFWVGFWTIFIFFDLYPSIVRYVSQILDLEYNMYILTAGAVLTLFVLVFVLYCFLSDLSQKVTKLVREMALIDIKLARMLKVVSDEENRHSDPSS
jgi:hypothetical protein